MHLDSRAVALFADDACSESQKRSMQSLRAGQRPEMDTQCFENEVCTLEHFAGIFISEVESEVSGVYICTYVRDCINL